MTVEFQQALNDLRAAVLADDAVAIRATSARVSSLWANNSWMASE